MTTARASNPGELTPLDYARYLRIATAILRDLDEAKDAVQSALQKSLEKGHTFDGRAQYQSWVTAIVINQCLMRLRHTKRWRKMPVDESGDVRDLPARAANPERDFARKELLLLVRQEMQLIPRLYRDAVILRDLEDRPLEEIARKLGMSMSAVKSRITRGRIELRNRLERLGVTAHLLASRPAMQGRGYQYD